MTLERRFLVLSALRWLPTGLLIPVTAVFMLERGLSLAQVGLVAGAQGVAVLLLELPTGGLADSLGRRRVLLLVGALDVVALALFVTSHSLVAFAVAWLVQGAFRALDSGPLEAWYVDESLAGDAGADIERGIARAGTVVGIAISAGALGAAGLVATGRAVGTDALVLPVVAALVLRIVDLAAVAALLDEARDVVAESVRGAVRSGLRVVRRGRALRALVTVELVWGAGLVGVELLSGPRLAELFGNAEDGVVTLGVTAAIAWTISGLGSAATGWLVVRCGSPAMAGVATRVAQGLAVAVMAVVVGPAGLVAGYLAFYLVHGAANAVHYGMVHRLVGPGERATVLSVSSLTARIGGTAADVGFGALAAGAGISAAFWTSALLLVAGAPLYVIAGRAHDGGRDARDGAAPHARV